MNDELIKLLLDLPLTVRLALLDADPTGAGWYVAPDLGAPALFEAPPRAVRNDVKRNCAWLPANPLAIVEYAKRKIPTATQAFMGREQGTHEWVVFVEVWRNTPGLAKYAHTAHGSCPYTAAIALLRKVVDP